MSFELTEEEKEELRLLGYDEESELAGESDFDSFSLTEDEQFEIDEYRNILAEERRVADEDYVNQYVNKKPEDQELDDILDDNEDFEFKSKYSQELSGSQGYDDNELIDSITNEIPVVGQFFQNMAKAGKVTEEQSKSFSENANAILDLVNNLGKTQNEIKDNWVVRNILRPFGKGAEGTTNRALLAYEAMQGNKQAEKGVAEIDRSFADVDQGDGKIEFGVRAVSKLLGQMTQTARNNIGYIASGALLGATKAFVAGQVGPQALIPEEIVTVPAGMLGGAAIGYKSASAFDTFRMESGNTWYELKDEVDDEGKPLDNNILKAVSYAVGGINAGMDQVGLDAMMESFALTKETGLTKEVINKSIKSALKSKVFRNRVLNIAKKHAIGTATETITEMAQEITPLIAKYALTDKTFDIKEIGRVSGAVGLETLVGTGLLGVPSSMYNVSSSFDVVNNQIKAVEQREQSFQEFAYNLPYEDRKAIVDSIKEESGEDIEVVTLTGEDGKISEDAKTKLKNTFESYLAEQEQLQSEIDAKVNRKLEKMAFDDEVKEVNEMVNKLTEQAKKATDPATKRELIAQAIQLEEDLDEFKQQDPELAEVKDAGEEIETTDADKEILAELEEEVGTPEGEITGREYMTDQVQIMEKIMENTGLNAVQASEFYNKHFRKQFREEHQIHEDTVTDKLAEEGELIQEPVDEAVVEEEVTTEQAPLKIESIEQAIDEAVEVERAKQEDLISGETPLVDAPKLAEEIQELKTDEELKAEKEKPIGKAKERAKGFKEITETPKPDTVKTTIKKAMDWLESKSKEIARGKRDEIVKIQKELAKLTRETLTGEYSGLRKNMINRVIEIGKAKTEETRQKRYDEAVEYMRGLIEKEDAKVAIKAVRKTIDKLKKAQRKVTTKTGREGFGTKETGKVKEQIDAKRGEVKVLEDSLKEAKTDKQRSALQSKITRLNNEANKLEEFSNAVSDTEGPNEAIRRELDNIIDVSTVTMNKITEAQQQYTDGKLKKIPSAYQKVIDDLANGKININDLTALEATQLNDKLLALAEGKKAISKYIHNETQAQNQARIIKSVQEIAENHNVTPASGDNVVSKKGAINWFKGEVRRPNLILQFLGKGVDSHTWANTYGKANDASNNTNRILRRFFERNSEIFEDASKGDADFFDAITKPYAEVNGKMRTINEIMKMYAVSKSPDGQRILGNSGYETDPSVYKKLLGPKYSKAVDAYQEFLATEVYDVLNTEYRRQYGVDMPRAEGTYFPIMSLETSFEKQDLSIDELGEKYIMPEIKDGMTHERVPHNYKFTNFDFFGETALYEKRVARYAGESELLSQVRNLVKSTEFQNIAKSVNSYYANYLNDWVDHLISGEQYKASDYNTSWDKVYTMRNNFTKSVLAGRISVIAKQVPSLLNATPELTVEGFKDVLYALSNNADINELVDSKSEMMKNRPKESKDRVLQHLNTARKTGGKIENNAKRIASKIKHTHDKAVDTMFEHGITAIDKRVTNAIWYARYMDAKRAGESESKAIQSADLLVVETQPTFRNIDLAKVDRGRVLGLFKMFGSQRLQNLNRIIDVFEGGKMGLSASSRFKHARGVLQSTLAISMLGLMAAWAKNYYDEDDEDEKVSFKEYVEEHGEKRFVMDLQSSVLGGSPHLGTGSEILTRKAYNWMTDQESTWFENKRDERGLLNTPALYAWDTAKTGLDALEDENYDRAFDYFKKTAETLAGSPVSGTIDSVKQVLGILEFIKDQFKEGDPRRVNIEAYETLFDK